MSSTGPQFSGFDQGGQKDEEGLESFRCNYRFDGPSDGPLSSHDSRRCYRYVYPYAHHYQRSNTGSHPDPNICTGSHIFSHTRPIAKRYTHVLVSAYFTGWNV